MASRNVAQPVRALAACAALAACSGGGGRDRDVTPPTAPAAAQATATGATASVLEWALSSDDVAVAGYRILRDGAERATAAAPPFTDAGLAHGSRHCYAVVAMDATGNASAPGPEACATTELFEVATVDPTPGAGRACSVAVDGAGRVHVAYFAPDGVRHATSAPAGWKVEPVSADTPSGEERMRLAFDAAGGLHVVYEAGGLVRHATPAAAGWSVETVATGILGGLAVDASGALRVGFVDAVAGATRAAVATRANGTWAVSHLADAACCSVGLDLALDPDGHLQLAYEGPGGTLWFGTDAGGAFAATQLDTGGAAIASAAGADGSAHLAYYDFDRGEVRHATSRAGAWEVEHVTTVGHGGYFLGLALDGAGHAHVAAAAMPDLLVYATDASGAWATTTLPARGAYLGTGVAADAAGGVHLCFATVGGLAHASSR